MFTKSYAIEVRMITTLDVETTYQEGDPSPYNDKNKLVSVGINKEYYFFNH